jgi:hypothetical protein
MAELLSSLTEFFEKLPDPYKSALLPVIIVMPFCKMWFKAMSWNQEAGLIKLPAIRKKERLESVNFLTEQLLKDSLNEPEEILHMQEKRYALLFEETHGFSANKSMRKLITDFEAVAPSPMNNSKFISSASRYLANEESKLAVKFGFLERIYVLLCVFMCLLLLAATTAFSWFAGTMSFVGWLVFFGFLISVGVLFSIYLNDISSFIQASEIKKFIEKDKPKRTFLQWLKSVIRSFKSPVWMPKFNLQNSETSLQKMTHSEELFDQKGQNH